MPSMPEDFDPSQMQGAFGGQMPNMGELPEGFDPSQMPGGNWGPNMNGTGRTASSGANLIWLAVSVLVLGVGLLVAKLYKR